MLEYLSIALTSFMSIEVIIALIVGVVGGMVIGIIRVSGRPLVLPFCSRSPFPWADSSSGYDDSHVHHRRLRRFNHRCSLSPPGTAASAATAMDGYEMTKQGAAWKRFPLLR
ncbi:MAG: hypothetical protein ACLUOI_08780 [Eisenbergiella sp.]